MADVTLDLEGYCCPIPVLKARKVLRDMADGATLEVVATDPGAIPDFEALCEAIKVDLVSATEDQGVYRIVIRKPVSGGAAGP